MCWYRAEIRAEGYKVDDRGTSRAEKVIQYDFQAEDQVAADKKANEFARDPQTRSDFQFFDLNPLVFVAVLPKKEEPTREGARQIN